MEPAHITSLSHATEERKVTSIGSRSYWHAPYDLSNGQGGTSMLQQDSASYSMECSSFFPAPATTSNRVSRSCRSGRKSTVSVIMPEVAAGASTLMALVQKRATSYANEGPSSKERRTSRHGSTSPSERSTSDVPACPESSQDEEDSQFLEDLLVRIPQTASPAKSSRVSLDDADETAEAAADLLQAIKSESSTVSLPRVDDQYVTEAEFVRYVKAFTKQTGHKAYQLGGQGKYNCRVTCRNWKKKEYNPPGLACPYHFLASKTRTSEIFTIISAEPNHNQACKEREGITNTTVYETAHNSNSKKAARSRHVKQVRQASRTESQHIPYADYRRSARSVQNARKASQGHEEDTYCLPSENQPE
ncbi:hypothetical protein P389DRAFT_202345 [Cystobasidium minutum MCA 4210]|uniref:uncharacterized protein n=1 Tax=Cystobasidium minutum MCA 4210 TaxID=1397322 RepID=UPI0034CF296D|eukprot:jgi/Rhomi1/202345/MIX3174_97_46